MRRLWLFCAALLAGCSPAADDAAVVLYEPGYAIDVVIDNEDGITSPDGLWWDSGMLYIADEGGSAIRRWDGTRLETLADATSGIASPEDLVVDAQGQIWFTDDTAGGLWRVNPDGAQKVAGSQEITESEGIALRGDGTIWVGDGRTGRIQAFKADARRPAPVAAGWQVAKPESMALAPDGVLWLADNRRDRLLRIEADGTAREWLLPNDLSPETIAAHGEALWITDSHNGRLYRLEKDGEFKVVALFLADFININGIAVDTAGAVYVSIQSDLAMGRGYIVRFVPPTGEKRAE